MTGMDKVFKALADPSRRQLMDRLFAAGGQTLRELCQDLDMSRQAVAQHLGVLEAAGLVTTKWQGREKLHFLNPVPIRDIERRWIRKFERPRIDALRNLKRRIEGESNE
jgi:DNA-binding transcriptional ArsR family regulator